MAKLLCDIRQTTCIKLAARAGLRKATVSEIAEGGGRSRVLLEFDQRGVRFWTRDWTTRAAQ